MAGRPDARDRWRGARSSRCKVAGSALLSLLALPAGPLQLDLVDSLGRITIADCRATGIWPLFPPGVPILGGYGQITIRDSAQVVLSNISMSARLGGGPVVPACDVLRSTVAIERSMLVGSLGDSESFRGPGLALAVTDGACAVVDGELLGPLPGFRIDGGRAVQATRSPLSIAGSATRIVAGTAVPSAAILLEAAPLAIEPGLNATWTGTPNATVAPLASIGSANVALGQAATLKLRAAAGAFGAIFAGLPGDRTAMPGFGDLWLDPLQSCFRLGTFGVLPATGLTWSVSIPSTPALGGVQFRSQGAVFDGAVWSLSPPAVFVLR